MDVLHLKSMQRHKFSERIFPKLRFRPLLPITAIPRMLSCSDPDPLSESSCFQMGHVIEYFPQILVPHGKATSPDLSF